MKRAAVLGTVMALVALAAFTADAQHRGHGHGSSEEVRPAEPTAPNPAITALANGLTWGMTRDAVVAAIKQQIKDKYWPDILASADDGVAEQALRNRMERDQNAFESSCVKFDGQSTPWDVSMIDGEFTHRNQEEMCKLEAGDHTDHYFFIRGKFWKIFRALNAGGLAAAPPTFEDMRAQMESEFGPGEEVRKVNTYLLTSELIGLRWIDSQTELRLMWLDLYSIFAVVLTDRGTLGNLANLRTNVAASTGDGTGSLVNAITTGSATDENTDIVQRLTGHRPDPTAPDGGDAGTTAPDAARPQQVPLIQ